MKDDAAKRLGIERLVEQIPHLFTELASDLHLPQRPVAAVAERVFAAKLAQGIQDDAGTADARTNEALADAGALTRVSLIDPVASSVPSGGPAANVFRTRAPSVVVIHTIERLESTGMAPMLRQLGMKTARASGSGFVAKSDAKKSLVPSISSCARSAACPCSRDWRRGARRWRRSSSPRARWARRSAT